MEWMTDWKLMEGKKESDRSDRIVEKRLIEARYNRRLENDWMMEVKVMAGKGMMGRIKRLAVQ